MTKNYTAEDILQALSTHYKESIFVSDGEGNVIFVNDIGAERIGAKNKEEILYRNVKDLVKDGYYDNSPILKAIETKKETFATIRYKNENASVSHSVPVLDDNRNVTMVVTNNMSTEHSNEWANILSKEHANMEKLRRELDYLRLQDHGTMIVNSPKMKNVIQTVNAIAPTDSNVVILGESGTGKDMMARYIHERSNRSREAFISINCAALPEQLLESELFGYEAGAFTGALSKGKIGLFEAASGGTIFLDEIGDMPLSLQSKLLRALENREIRRVGGVKSIPIDVRIICATNVNLEIMVQEKNFREDLYYRLNVFLVNIPPLSERKEDIIPIAESFLKGLNEKYGTNKVISPISIGTMLNHNWPGNIRELRNVMERIYVVSPGNELIFTPVPTAEFSKDVYEMSAKEENAQPLQYDSLKDYMNSVELEYINKVLKDCNGAIGEAAKRLGIHRSVLYRKLHKER